MNENLSPLARKNGYRWTCMAQHRSPNMTLKELADKLAALDEDAFVSALQLEYTHDDEPGQVKTLMVDALRFADANGMKVTKPRLDSAD
jgi:hypothetical protein